MKTAIFLGVVIVAAVVIGVKVREDYEKHLRETGDLSETVFTVGGEKEFWVRDSPFEDPVDEVLWSVLSGCLEAYCEDCSHVLAVGTPPYHDKVSEAAYVHGETFDHETYVRSWAD